MARDWFGDTVAFGGVSSSSHPWASAAGAEMLAKGGSAVDAAIATAFTLAVCEPAMSHLGGQGNMVVHLAGQRESIALDFYACAPGAAGPGMYRWAGGATQGGYRFHTEGDLNTTGGLSVCIPGNVCGWLTAHRRWGRLALGTVVGPALRACDGVPLTRSMAARVVENRERLARFGEAARLFLHADGSPHGEGQVIRQPELGETIARIAAGGEDAFYTGDIAERIVRHVRGHGGILTLEDLATYPEHRLWVRAPDHVAFHGHQVECATPSSSAVLLNLLGILDGLDLTGLEPLSAGQLHLLIESMKLSFAERNLYIGDHRQVNVPLAGLLSPGYTAMRRQLIDPEQARFPGPGDPWAFQEEGPDPRLLTPSDPSAADGGCTTHHSHVDGEGNFVALTQSLGDAFGSCLLVPGLGVLLNNAMKLFDPRPGPRAQGIAPYRRPLAPSPTLVRRSDGRAVLALGSPSGTRIPNAIAQVLVNVLVHSLSLRDAVELPRVHWSGDELEAEADLPEAARRGLDRRGHRAQYRHAHSPWFGAVQVVSRDPDTGVCRGAADSRRGGAVSAVTAT